MANEKRVRLNNVFGTLGALMTNVATTIDFGSAPAGLISMDATKHLAIIIEPDSANEEIVYLTTYTAGNSTGTIARGQEGTTAVQHLANAPWIHGPTKRDMAAGRAAYASRGSGNLTISSASWVAVDAGLDLALPAFPGDLIEAGWMALLGSSGDCCMDIATMVAGAITNVFSTKGAQSTNGQGLGIGRGVGGMYSTSGGTSFYVVTAADLVSGKVNLRWIYKMISGSKTVYAESTTVNGVTAEFMAKNHGPQEA